MKILSSLRSFTSALFHRSRFEGDMDDELRAHIRDRANDLERSGLPRAEAERRARLDFGGYQKFKEECRDSVRTHFVDSLAQDVRFALRMFRKSPGFSAIAVLTLALGIGAVTLIFSATYGVILNTFPFPNADQVTSFSIQDLSRPGGGRESLSIPELLYFREHSRAFQDFSGEYGGFGTTPLRYTAGKATYQFDADFLSVNSFRLFGVRPVLGRLPTGDDVKAAATPVFVMGYKLWRSQFNSDPNIVGKNFTLNGVSRTLVGIMPPRFRWAWVDIWVPFSVDPAEALTNPDLKSQFVYTVGRRKAGVSLDQAAADLNILAHQYAKIEPRLYPKRFTVTAASLAERVTAGFKTLIYPLLGAVLMLLLISCTNIANLLLSRATAREKEIAIRASLGASRGRLVRQLLVESSLLAVAGCLAGCFLAWLGIQVVVPLIPYNAFPQEAVITLNPAVLAAAVAVSLLSTVLFGLVPALHSVRRELQPRLVVGQRTSSSGFRQGRLRSVLVIGEVVLSIILLVGAGLMMRTFWNIKNVDLGFNPHNLLAMQLAFPRTNEHTQQDAQRDTEKENTISQRLLERVEALPGVAGAAFALSLPPYRPIQSEIAIPGKTHPERWTSFIDPCSRDYFDALHLRLIYGRNFSRDEIALPRPVAVISEAFAQKYFGAQNPVGQDIHFLLLDQIPDWNGKVFEIVGVVADVKNAGLKAPPLPEAYVPFTTVGANGAFLLVNSVVAPDSLISAIRQESFDVDSDLALTNPKTIEGMLQRDAFSSPRFEFIILTVFAAIALALLVAGIFSVMGYTVSLRTREIGVRLALGASRTTIMRMVLRRGLWLAAAGIVLGVGSSLALTRFLQRFLFGIQATDPLTFAAVSILVVVTALAACWIPARRAMNVDPIAALRHE